MTDINTTVTNSLRSNGLHGYADSARPVVADLVAREQDLAEAIVTAARQRGVRESDTRNALRGAGMEVREGRNVEAVPTPAAAPNTQATQARGVQDSTISLLTEVRDILKKVAKRTKNM